MKKCAKCNSILPKKLFTNQPSSSDGISAWCKRCKAKHELSRINNNPALKEKYRKKARERGRSNPILNRERAKAWALKHPEKTKSRSFSNHIKQFYNITPDDYDHMLDMQGGGCAICGAKPNHGDRRLHVDHDHATGQIRGLLCFGCNAGLGMFKDNINSFNNAIAYVAGNGKWKEMRKAFITLSGLLFSPEEIYKAVQEDDKKFH